MKPTDPKEQLKEDQMTTRSAAESPELTVNTTVGDSAARITSCDNLRL